MTLKAEDLHKAAHLARLNIEPEATTPYLQALSSILALVDEMQGINTDGVLPMAHPMDATQRLRIDEVTETNQRDTLQKIAPATENGLYLVPRVIE
ncbi:MAG: Asp-tRNA(Asn)/Glu-tRNA(Gln) amidotransferase subunit GatC [Marinospirillum sp.]|uniref:Asp-tRNA(Asn)/Glu-tRNA(Gln) amidotransferase subunit GatC n=1 Tax=Marinospirillum sp. TaxID=2183934 RepID=UPI001A01B8A3|nr:Asp-tRNA(Asn)/Glu-tRNA(Gln) amidotransferase subunit GatC [Marinospirillum sp.]MBE0507405.1 Asp-tRNA(Asn)/Glu-tRNA(Gln) amidotransferase subunit GatC [Marinospirillum sp.]